MKTFNPQIFKTYDVRGIYPREINETAAYAVGWALARYTQARRIAVARDMRISSLALEKALIEGIIEEGAVAVNIGLVSTPMLYHATGKLDVDAGVIVTASHNPAEYNGFKMCLKEAAPIGEGSGMEEIKMLALEAVKRVQDNSNNERGKEKKEEQIKQAYLEYAASFFNITAAKKRKIVIDFANGMGALDKELYWKLLKEIEPVFLFEELDGTFPNHEANPLKKETLKSLQKKVIEEQADLGIAYDGDADRIGFVDEKGKIVPMDFITALLAREVLKKHPGGLVLMDLRSSNAVKEAIEAAGGQVHRCRVGHSLIKRQMREEGAVFAGELSGHYFFEENFKAEMTALAVVMVLNLMNENGKKISELTEELRKYYHSGEINFEVTDKEAVFKRLRARYFDGKWDELDGVRVDYPDWWFNVRASNTEPVIRLNLEAISQELMEEKKRELAAVIERE